ncbi:MAG: DNA-3-methyladenine glycosylase I [Alphaproteobacteria bacterium]
MRTFKQLHALAAKRKGGAAALETLMPDVKSPAALVKIPDDRWLSAMSKRIFQAGFNWTVVENKWPGHEEAFSGFNPHRCAFLSDEDIETLAKDTRIIRNIAKIAAVRDNAAFLNGLTKEHGSAAKFFAQWPDSDLVGLLQLMGKQASRLSGSTAQMVLRDMGKDTFILTQDVCAALIREGVVTKKPSSQRDMIAVQAAFNKWRGESDRPFAHISRILAFSVENTSQ